MSFRSARLLREVEGPDDIGMQTLQRRVDRMSWLSPLNNVNYTKPRKCGTAFRLSQRQIQRVKDALNGLRPYTTLRSDTIKSLASQMGCNETTVRRAETR